MVVEDDTFVIHGPKPNHEVPTESLGKIIHDSLLEESTREDVAMVDAFTGKTITYKLLLEEACNLAEALRRYGCDTNTVISICSENKVEFYIPILASLLAGTIMAPVSHFYTPDELNHTLNIFHPKIIFSAKDVAPKFVLVKEKLKYIDRIVIIDDEKPISGTQSLQEFLNEMLGRTRVTVSNFRPWCGNSTEQVALIMCSSGTTGLPKGVMLTQTNILVRLAQTWNPRYSFSNRGSVVGILPFFHAYGLVSGLTSIINKNMIVSFKKFEEDIFLSSIEKYRIHTLLLAPPLALFLAKTEKLQYYDVSSVKNVTCGAAPLPQDIETLLKNRLNVTAIHQGYGLTEATLAVTMMENNVGRTGSSGPVITYMSVKVRDPTTGRSLGPNQIGEICVKGPMLMKGYYKNEAATRDTYTSDGWLLSGDLGYYDNDKFFYIVERLKELIKYKGFQVAPAELEALLINHPKVMDVGVAGLPDQIAGELPTAFVVKKMENVTEKELQDYVAEKVSPQKRLRGGVIFVSAVPKNASGKILRRELKNKLIEMLKPTKLKSSL